MHLLEALLHTEGHLEEISRHQACKESQADVKQGIARNEALGDDRRILHRLPKKPIGRQDGDKRRADDGHQGIERQVDHKHLKGKDNTRDRRLEDGCQGRRATHADKQDGVLIVQFQQLGDVGAYAATRRHAGTFQSHRATKTDSQGASDDTRPGAAMVHLTFVFRNGIKDAWDAMADVLLEDVLTEQDGQQDTDGGANEIKQVGIVELRVDDQIANAVCQFLDDDSGGTSQETRWDAEYQHETTVGHVRRTPCIEAVNPSVDFVFGFTHNLTFFGR